MAEANLRGIQVKTKQRKGNLLAAKQKVIASYITCAYTLCTVMFFSEITAKY